MRCIEIRGSKRRENKAQEINRNMRCIEITMPERTHGSAVAD